MPWFHFFEVYFLCKAWGVTEQLLNVFEKNVLLSAKYKTYRDISHLNRLNSTSALFQLTDVLPVTLVPRQRFTKLTKLSRGKGSQQFHVLLDHGSNLFNCVTCLHHTTAGITVSNFQLLIKFHQCTLHILSDAKQHNVAIKVHKTTCTYFHTAWFHILGHKHIHTYKISSNSHP